MEPTGRLIKQFNGDIPFDSTSYFGTSLVSTFNKPDQSGNAIVYPEVMFVTKGETSDKPHHHTGFVVRKGYTWLFVEVEDSESVSLYKVRINKAMRTGENRMYIRASTAKQCS